MYCSIIKKHWKLLSIRNDAENALTNILKNKTNLLEGIIINNVLEVNKAEFSGTMKYPYFIKLNYSVNNKIFINLKTLLSTINELHKDNKFKIYAEILNKMNDDMDHWINFGFDEHEVKANEDYKNITNIENLKNRLELIFNFNNT